MSDLTVTSKVSSFFTRYPLRTFAKHETVISDDEVSPPVFYLLEGRVSKYDITAEGKELIVNIYKPGAFFPMSNALTGAPNRYFYEASTAAKAHVAPAADAAAFLRSNPDVTLDLLQRIYRGMDGVLRRMVHLMDGNASHRLLFEILNSAYRFGEPRRDGSLSVPLTEIDLSKQSGLARETVNRNIQAFKTAGLLTVTHTGIVIKDLEQLERILNDAG